MPATYEGNTVTVLRPATYEDPGFIEGTEQCLIRLSDGTERIVPKADIKDNEVKEAPMKEPAKEKTVVSKAKAPRRLVANSKHMAKRKHGSHAAHR